MHHAWIYPILTDRGPGRPCRRCPTPSPDRAATAPTPCSSGCTCRPTSTSATSCTSAPPVPTPSATPPTSTAFRSPTSSSSSGHGPAVSTVAEREPRHRSDKLPKSPAEPSRTWSARSITGAMRERCFSGGAHGRERVGGRDRVHQRGQGVGGQPPHASALVLACTGYAVGIATYVFAVKYLELLTDVGPEVQTVGWFTAHDYRCCARQRPHSFTWPLPTKFLWATVTVAALVLIAVRTGAETRRRSG